jgi:glyoxylase-like metal-dependent hydrolase (beta-lactamase superfamily II)
VTHPIDGVTCIRIDNLVTRALSRIGGYDYSVCYLVDGALLVDTGFPWARRCLRSTLLRLGADKTIRDVVNTHYHEDHIGNNDLLAALSGARIMAHALAIPEIRFPPQLPVFRRFLFGPAPTFDVLPVPDRIETPRFSFDVLHLPGHCPGHICLFEPTRRWLFSGDLYIAADLDSQLADADGPLWIDSLERAIALRAVCMFDAHGTVLTDESAVLRLLQQKLDFLVELRRRILDAADRAQSIPEITRRVFARSTWVDRLSLSDGWLSLLTGSDFSRGNVVRSFLRDSQGNEQQAGEDRLEVRHSK